MAGTYTRLLHHSLCGLACAYGCRRYRYNWPVNRLTRTTRMAKKKAVAAKKPKMDRDFMDLLKAANTPEEAGNNASAIDASVIGLFETALTTLKDAKHRVAQDKDITKELLNAIEYLQFGSSKLKTASK